MRGYYFGYDPWATNMVAYHGRMVHHLHMYHYSKLCIPTHNKHMYHYFELCVPTHNNW